MAKRPQSFWLRTWDTAALILAESLSVTAIVSLFLDTVPGISDFELKPVIKLGLVCGGLGGLILTAAAKEQEKKKGGWREVIWTSALGVVMVVIGTSVILLNAT